MNQKNSNDFSARVLSWFDHFGRKDLPWQHNINPYRVWLSEIMLQQTQVATVIPYFQRFVEQFPDVAALSNATDDQVMHLWTGLGYYSRARNLHKTAKQVCQQYGGHFPSNVEQLCELPGIGRSTAGAIASIAFGQPTAILDGNVKRVLARFYAVAGWPGQSCVLKSLWQYAETHTPNQRTADYSQAMMDLGATLCTRSKPACPDCPLISDCQAYKQGNPQDYPGKKPKKALPVKTAQVLIIRNPAGEVLLEKRPPSGIWGGLWVFPEIDSQACAQQYCLDQLGLSVTDIAPQPLYRHTFSHYHFDLSPVIIQLQQQPVTIMEANRQLWYNLQQPPAIGLAAPIKKLISQLG